MHLRWTRWKRAVIQYNFRCRSVILVVLCAFTQPSSNHILATLRICWSIMQRHLLGTILLGIVLIGGGCKQAGSAKTISHQMSSIEEEPQADFLGKKQAEENNFVLPKQKLSALEQEYIGLTVKQAQSLAQQQNREFRIGSQDGEPYSLTLDYCFGRITASVKSGLVSSIDVEPRH